MGKLYESIVKTAEDIAGSNVGTSGGTLFVMIKYNSRGEVDAQIYQLNKSDVARYISLVHTAKGDDEAESMVESIDGLGGIYDLFDAVSRSKPKIMKIINGNQSVYINASGEEKQIAMGPTRAAATEAMAFEKGQNTFDI